MAKALTPPHKWHGGKTYLAKRIVELMPPRCKNPNAPAKDDPGWCYYVEPFFGAGAVLLENDPEGISEVVNDSNGTLINFWKVLQNVEDFEVFRRQVEAIPVSQDHWEAAEPGLTSLLRVDRAVAFFIRCRQSRSGLMTSFTPMVRNRTRRGMNESASAWLGAIEGLAAVHARLKRVAILSKDGFAVIRKEDGPRTLFYLDPPYIHETRVSTKAYGEHEMTEAQHKELLDIIMAAQGKVMISGYDSDLYNNRLTALMGWKRHAFDMPNHVAGGKEKSRTTEVVWCNF